MRSGLQTKSYCQFITSFGVFLAGVNSRDPHMDVSTELECELYSKIPLLDVL